jgi:hypothetical protein
LIVTRPRDWARITSNLDSIGARRVFLMGCGQCATVAGTGGEKEILVAKARLEAEGYKVTGWAIGEVACHLGGVGLETRKHRGTLDAADAVVVHAKAGLSRPGELVSRQCPAPRGV